MNDETGLPPGIILEATGSCFWKHKWSRWTECQTVIGYKSDPSKEYLQASQRRYCIKCGKVQVEKINS